MKVKNLIYSAAALAIGVAAFNIGSQAQGPLWDKVIVNLPYAVTVGEKTIEPGEYSIKQLSSPGGAQRVLLIYKDDVEFETSAMTIPTLDQNTPEDTKVVLHHIGSDYYFDKIWIQGKNYGYEFILPDAVKARQRERMEPVSVAARYETVPAETEQVAETETQRQETVTENQREETVAQQTTPAPEPAPVTREPEVEQEQQVAQAPPAPQPEFEQEQQPVTRQPDFQADREMPETSANWMMMLLGGGVLSGLGLALRRS
jgi:hypothetical protein